jgi:arylsulfatase A-like enzyme
VLLFQPDDLYQSYRAAWHAPLDPGFNLPVAAAALTPNMDRVGAEGAVFTAAYTASGMCAPSRLALLTGRYASRGSYAISRTSSGAASVTVPHSKLTGADATQNLARALSSVGYTTFQAGKWHLASDDDLQQLGCATSMTSEYDCTYAVQQAAVRAAGFDSSDALYISNLNSCGATCMNTFSHNLEWMAAATLAFLSSALDASSPFFAYVNPTPPHQGSQTDGDWARNALQDTSASTGFGPYDCSSSPAGTLSAAWTASCAGGRSGAPDYSAWCSSCSMRSRDAIWADANGGASALRPEAHLEEGAHETLCRPPADVNAVSATP